MDELSDICGAFHYWVYLTLSRGKLKLQGSWGVACGSRLQQFGSQAGYLAALAGGQRDVPKAALAGKGMDQHREGVV